jgi:hypothetical protein
MPGGPTRYCRLARQTGQFAQFSERQEQGFHAGNGQGSAGSRMVALSVSRAFVGAGSTGTASPRSAIPAAAPRTPARAVVLAFHSAGTRTSTAGSGRTGGPPDGGSVPRAERTKCRNSSQISWVRTAAVAERGAWRFTDRYPLLAVAGELSGVEFRSCRPRY